MEEWHSRMASEFKNRTNPVRIGAVLGEVISTSPWEVVIKDGKFKINASNGYVCFQLIHHITTYSYRHSGTIAHKDCPGSPPYSCLLYTSPSPRDMRRSRMPSSA